jgi:hypothetical protein
MRDRRNHLPSPRREEVRSEHRHIGIEIHAGHIRRAHTAYQATTRLLPQWLRAVAMIDSAADLRAPKERRCPLSTRFSPFL